MSIYDAAMKYGEEKVPLLVLAGKEYGSGSSRDWAAKGPLLLGIRAVLAESYERIHRSNLVGMGILPLQFRSGDTISSLGLNGEEIYDLEGLPISWRAVSPMDARLPLGAALTGRSVVSKPSFVLIHRRKCAITSTAVSCNTFCGSLWLRSDVETLRQQAGRFHGLLAIKKGQNI